MSRGRSRRTRTIVYVDGFNFYYGCLKDTPERWLDVGALCGRMLQNTDNEIVGIKYFTARVKARDGNPQQVQRQQVYLRALATVPNLTIHYGAFITKPVVRRCVKDRKGKASYVEVWNTEEKGSDVNLASHLIIDGHKARYDLAVIVSNDSDLKFPVEYVRNELKAPVGVLNPHKNRSWGLSPKELPRGSFYKPIRRAALRASQFPPQVPDVQGIIHKPPGW